MFSTISFVIIVVVSLIIGLGHTTRSYLRLVYIGIPRREAEVLSFHSFEDGSKITVIIEKNFSYYGT